MDFLCLRIQQGVDLFKCHENSAEDLFGDSGKEIFNKPFEGERSFIKNDYSLFKKDLKKVGNFRLSLPYQGKRGFKELEAVYAENPSSIMFPTWARQEGKVLIITNLNNRRKS